MDAVDVDRAIRQERARQDAQWGGPEHDDLHTPDEWRIILREHTLKALRAPAHYLEKDERIIQEATVGEAVIDRLERALAEIERLEVNAPSWRDDIVMR